MPFYAFVYLSGRQTNNVAAKIQPCPCAKIQGRGEFPKRGEFLRRGEFGQHGEFLTHGEFWYKKLPRRDKERTMENKMAQRHFLVTIGADTELDVHDVQGAIVYEAERAHDDDVDHGDVDVQLIEADKVDHMSNYKITTIRYSVLDAC